VFGAYSSDPWILTDGANLSYWQTQSLIANTSVADTGGAGPGFSRVQLVFDRTTPALTREDVAVASFSWAQAAAGVCTKLSDADKSSIDTALNSWWTAVKPLVHSGISLREYRWYDYQPIDPRPGPVVRVTANGAAGTAGTGRVPDQLAVSQTFKSASRKHWGRWYLPGIAQNALESTYGRITSGTVTSLQASTRTLLQNVGATGYVCPVIASIQYHGVMGLRELQTDNIWDVIRSRRAKQPTQRVTNSS